MLDVLEMKRLGTISGVSKGDKIRHDRLCSAIIWTQEVDELEKIHLKNGGNKGKVKTKEDVEGWNEMQGIEQIEATWFTGYDTLSMG